MNREIKIEKVENGYVIKYHNAFERTEVFKTLRDVLEFVDDYFKDN